jgi:hypothetical protein
VPEPSVVADLPWFAPSTMETVAPVIMPDVVPSATCPLSENAVGPAVGHLECHVDPVEPERAVRGVVQVG